MAVTVAAAVATVVQGTDGTETVPVLMSAVIAAAELSAGANGTVIDPDFTAATITAITLANPGVFTTSAAHGLVVNDKVYITGITGTTQVNNRSYIVNTVPSTTTFTLKTERGTSFVSDVLNTSTYTAWSAGGTVYLLLHSGQLIGVRVDVGANPAAWLKVDDGFTYVARTSTRLNPASENAANNNNGGAVVLGYRSTSIIRTTSSYNDNNCLACATGGRFFALRTPNGESPSIIHDGTIRNDWPTLTSGTAPAEYRIEGLFVRSTADSRKWYGGQSRNVGTRDTLSNLNLSGAGEIFQTRATTYQSGSIPVLTVGGDYSGFTSVELIQCALGTELAASADIDGTLRQTYEWITDCTFGGWWSGVLTPASDTTAGAYQGVRYTHKVTLKNGNTAISSATARRSRSVVSGSINYDLSALVFGPETATTFTTTDGSGVSTAKCTDAFWAHATAGVAGKPGTERYQWSMRIRKYGYRTFSDDLFTARRYGQGGLLAGVTEEIQCEVVTFLVLSEAAAAALTNIALAPSGATAGTATMTATRTIQELWQYYRQWIVQTANFTSDDTWSALSATSLTFGAWTIAATLTAGGSYTYLGGTIDVDLINPTFTGGTANIGAATTYAFSTVGTIVSMTPAAASSYVFTGTHGGTLSLKNTSAFAITVQVPLGTTTTTAANTGGTITVVNPPITLQFLRPNVINGSNYIIKNVTQATEIASGTVSGGTGISATFTLGVAYNAADVLEIRIGYCVGTAAKLTITEQATAPSGNAVNSAPTAQVAYDVYNSVAIDGSSRTEFAADYPNNEVNVVVASDFYGQNFMAWWVYNEATLNGLRNFIGKYTLIDEGNIRNNTALGIVLFDNTTTANIKQIDNARIFRSDGGYPVKNPSSGGGSIDINWRNAVQTIAVGSAVLPADITAISAAVWAATSESSQSYGKQFRDVRATLLGKTTGGGTASEAFLAADGTTTRVTSTNDGTNRTAVAVPGA